MELMTFIKSLLPFMKKDQVIEDLAVTLREMETHVIPSYDNAIKTYEKLRLKSKEGISLNKVFYTGFKGRTGAALNLIVSIQKSLPNVLANIRSLEELASKELDTDIVAEGISAKKANLIQLSTYASFISSFSMDVIEYITFFETQAISKDPSEDSIPKYRLQYIQDNILNYGRLLLLFSGSGRDFLSDFEKIPDITITSNNYSAASGIYNDRRLNPYGASLTQRFESSPIYHIRLVITEWQTARYKANEEKKQYLQLKLLELETELQNNPNLGLQKEIIYTRNRIDRIEADLKEMRESYQ